METQRQRLIRNFEVIDDDMVKVIGDKTGFERLKIASDMFVRARNMLLAHLRAEHPEWTQDQITSETARRLSHGTV